ncbi:glycoside hydrolase family 5 protein [Hyunsoonleella ulvae]|uniref:glycoside hydrolase family 5 protein n=1 Tax=Hyunsoonleella ulvae TaxID=2799948 RepID=UPI00193AA561|nr:cellulase family glycosylhydrolase [Hyunsoonleella ulvae]
MQTKGKIQIFIVVPIALLFTTLIMSISCLEDVETDNFKVYKGTNVAHWLSQSDRRGIERVSFFTEKDVKRIANMGFDHIRLPIDEEQMWDENGNRYNEAFSLMENCIKWCQKNNLRVIVDLHILRSHHFNAKEKPLWTDVTEQNKFFDLWKDLSKTLSKFPNSLVAYELMNEAVADDHESWNTLLAKAVAAIRELESERTIVIGSNRWQAVETFDALKVPENDKNILLSFHFYEPFLLSHYGAKWLSLRNYNGPVSYPGTILTRRDFEVLPEEMKIEVEKWVDMKYDKDVLLEMMQKPMLKAKALGLPLYCGEFGIISHAPEKESLIWYQDMIQLFKETGIGYANWNYKSDNFGLISSDSKENKNLIKIVSN